MIPAKSVLQTSYGAVTMPAHVKPCTSVFKPSIVTMPTYTVWEYLDMLLIYGECGQRARAAARMFHQRFPHLRPTHNVILDTVRRIEQSGRIRPTPPAGRHRIATDEATSAAVLAFVALHPHTSTRHVAIHAAISSRQWFAS